MLLDAESRDSTWFRDKIFDVCIVGTGPAGMSLAMRLADMGWKIGLFEGGGRDYTTESKDIYAGKNVGLNYFPLDASRLRFFGGTSNHWNGVCRPLEAFDFEPMPHSPHSGWPIRKSDLDPYRSAAETILEVGPPGPLFDLFSSDSGSLVPFQFGLSKPTRFGTRYGEQLSRSARIEVYLNANLVDLDLVRNRKRVVD